MRLIFGLVVVATIFAFSPVHSQGGLPALVAWLASALPGSSPAGAVAAGALASEWARRAGDVRSPPAPAPARHGGAGPL